MKRTVRRKGFQVISVVTLTTFFLTFVFPLSLLRADIRPQTAAGTSTPLAQYAQTLQAIEETLAQIQEQVARESDPTLTLQTLQTQWATLQALEPALQNHLATAEAQLNLFYQQGKVPADALTRHQEAVTEAADRAAILSSTLNTLLATPSEQLTQAQVQAARTVLQDLQPQGALQVLGSQPLPHRRAQIPKQIATLGNPIQPGLTPPTAADLAPTPDVPFTTEIQAQAQVLGFDPTEIYLHVRNTVDYQPYFGSVKGAQGVYWERAGNDMDQASYLIALLRASNFPARYVAGVVELPVQKVMDWTGVETPEAAVEVIASNGIPYLVQLSASGRPTAILFYHVWTEAYLPQSSKGAKTTAYEWIQLDPSFKAYQTKEGIDLETATGFDLSSFYARGPSQGPRLTRRNPGLQGLTRPISGRI